MTKEQFCLLLKEIRNQMPELAIRKGNLETYFIKAGYTIESGYTQVSYFYKELRQARDGEPSIFTNEINKITKIPGYFAWWCGNSIKLKISNEDFDSFAPLFEYSPPPPNDVNKRIKNDLQNKSITQRLDHWDSVKHTYIKNNPTEQWIGPPGKLQIPESLYNEYFKEGINNVEFAYWYLIHHSEYYFKNVLCQSFELDMLDIESIKAKLAHLNDFEQNAYTLSPKLEIDVLNPSTSPKYQNEIEFLRIKREYYKRHLLHNVHSIGNPAVKIYAEHIYLKNYLESKLTKTQLQNDHLKTPYEQVKDELIPFGLYYNLPTDVEHQDKEYTTENSRSEIKRYMLQNDGRFINLIKTKSELDFIKELNVHYSYYSEYAKVMTHWLSHTEKLIKRSIEDRYLKFHFTEWLKIKKEVRTQDLKVDAIQDKPLQDNTHPRIFTSIHSFHFFQSLQTTIRQRSKLADYSFIFRRMQKDGFINQYVGDNEFRDYLQTLSIEIGKTKLLDYCKTDLKESNYIAKRDLFPQLH